MKQKIGGERLGSGAKMEVDLRTYDRSTFDLGYLWRSTMAAGTLVPFMSELALPADTFDINLNCDINTHPTIGPLFGSFKVQLDVFQCPVRLYHAALNNNKLGIGMNMAQIKLPQLELKAKQVSMEKAAFGFSVDNDQINPSALLSYLNLRGVGDQVEPAVSVKREFNALPLISYWDVYKNYYANRQEGVGAFINNANVIEDNIQSIQFREGTTGALTPLPDSGGTPVTKVLTAATQIVITYLGDAPASSSIEIIMSTSEGRAINTLFFNRVDTTGTIVFSMTENPAISNVGLTIKSYTFTQPSEISILLQEPKVDTFPLENIDQLREAILQQDVATAFKLNHTDSKPYGACLENEDDVNPLMCSQQGLAIKTYQSDLFNNWIESETITGTNGISEITAIDTSSGSFTIDQVNLAKKVYDMLNRIAISGGSYDDWIDAVYTHDRYKPITSPVYHGGLIKELVFQEVISNTQASDQPLGTLAGRGVMGGKHKGGKISIRVDEPSYLIGIVSLTPRVDYSQGNKWDVHLKTMDDFHKPQLDEIGFQDLITEQMAWWDTKWNNTEAKWEQQSAGKQPAWMNYMTNVNQVRGNFAIEAGSEDEPTGGEGFMILNRRYECDGLGGGHIKDLTTYIDPVKFNQIFAQTSRDAQNFWVQIAVDITARRKMSSKIMPNL